MEIDPMTAKDAESLVLKLEAAGVTFWSRPHYVLTGETIPDGVELENLDPTDWDVDYVPTVPTLPETDPNARFLSGFTQFYKADPDFRQLIQEAAGELDMSRQQKQFEDSERQCDEANAAMGALHGPH